MTQYIVKLPLSVMVSKNKKFIINLNHYRNTHYILLNKAKVEYSSLIKKEVFGIPLLSKVKIDYYLYPKDNRKCDVANVCSIQDKFLCDALTKFNVIEEDNYTIIPNISFNFGSIDPTNPRVEAIITTI